MTTQSSPNLNLYLNTAAGLGVAGLAAHGLVTQYLHPTDDPEQQEAHDRQASLIGWGIGAATAAKNLAQLDWATARAAYTARDQEALVNFARDGLGGAIGAGMRVRGLAMGGYHLAFGRNWEQRGEGAGDLAHELAGSRIAGAFVAGLERAIPMGEEAKAITTGITELALGLVVPRVGARLGKYIDDHGARHAYRQPVRQRRQIPAPHDDDEPVTQGSATKVHVVSTDLPTRRKDYDTKCRRMKLNNYAY